MSASAVPDIARRIMAFHLASREPDQDDVVALAQLLKIADHSPQEAAAFQEVMHVVAGQPGRAKWNNRLHRDKGCASCKAPCRYGFFTLVSEPDFITLKAMLDVENKKLVQERMPSMYSGPTQRNTSGGSWGTGRASSRRRTWVTCPTACCCWGRQNRALPCRRHSSKCT